MPPATLLAPACPFYPNVHSRTVDQGCAGFHPVLLQRRCLSWALACHCLCHSALFAGSRVVLHWSLPPQRGRGHTVPCSAEGSRQLASEAAVSSCRRSPLIQQHRVPHKAGMHLAASQQPARGPAAWWAVVWAWALGGSPACSHRCLAADPQVLGLVWALQGQAGSAQG